MFVKYINNSECPIYSELLSKVRTAISLLLPERIIQERGET
jgi:hypothetical protein